MEKVWLRGYCHENKKAEGLFKTTQALDYILIEFSIQYEQMNYLHFYIKALWGWFGTSISWHVGCYPGQLTGHSVKTEIDRVENSFLENIWITEI